MVAGCQPALLLLVLIVWCALLMHPLPLPVPAQGHACPNPSSHVFALVPLDQLLRPALKASFRHWALWLVHLQGYPWLGCVRRAH